MSAAGPAIEQARRCKKLCKCKSIENHTTVRCWPECTHDFQYMSIYAIGSLFCAILRIAWHHFPTSSPCGRMS